MSYAIPSATSVLGELRHLSTWSLAFSMPAKFVCSCLHGVEETVREPLILRVVAYTRTNQGPFGGI
jgi:hypothetical protein